jgi:peptide chain release factor 3
MLQFDVFKYRLKSEYGADSNIETMPWKVLRWIECDLSDDLLSELLPYESAIAFDENDRRVILFSGDWSMEHFVERQQGKVSLSHSPIVHTELPTSQENA